MGEREWKLLLYTKWRCELDYHYKGRMELGLKRKKKIIERGSRVDR